MLPASEISLFFNSQYFINGLIYDFGFWNVDMHEWKEQSRLFLYWRGMGGVSPSQKFAHSPYLELSPHPVDSPLPTKFLFSPTKQQFSSYNPIKKVFLALFIAPAPFLC